MLKLCSLFFVMVSFTMHASLITGRRICKRMLDYRLLNRAKLCVFSIIAFSAIIFLIYADSLVFNKSKTSAAEETSEVFQAHKSKARIRSAVIRVQLRSMKEEKDDKIDDGSDQIILVAPFNVTEEERVAWFRKKLPEFKIFKSNNLTRQFHGRVLEFFSHGCEAQFFMTWISPASSFGGREMLSLESLFKVHPQVCLMILSRTMDSKHGYRILKPLLDRGFKVHAVTPDLPFLFKGTPAEAWFHELRRGNKDPGEIPLSQNLSNLIRLAVLYKYGGIYLDTDFVVLKPFTGLRNSIGAQSMDMVSKKWTRLNNAVLVFDINHPLLFKFIEEFALTFDGNKWGHNGPYLVSRVVERLGKRPGYNFTVLPPMAFYPVDWTRIGGLFKKPKSQGESRWVEAKLLQLRVESYGVHLWNKQSNSLTIEEGSIIGKLIANHCLIYNHVYSS
ncbi:Lactosylceramide 4-alpha-galactosyltransferase [Quillaja saponaria]|uniref:Lactosylceramide 4-alpha-galactosyltransferase n=1 Tax=Quillaja saponaria TaxID=32244 RepID=A0AAD7KPJ0_QUISA|nr:Lactosylceramide 4-alpha-galactosyltransferase [Quillaja saponaria]